MRSELLWGLFCKTGDPAAYLLYRSARRRLPEHSGAPENSLPSPV